MNSFREELDGNFRLHIALEADEVVQFKKWITDRALNTLEPKLWPPFAKELDAAADDFIKRHRTTVAP